MKRVSLAAPCLLALAACLPPRSAHADPFVLDTGTPTTSTYPVFNNADWFAAEFYAPAGTTITQLSVYIASIASGNGDTFAFDIYTDDGGTFLSTRNAQLSPLLAYSATGTYTASGWNPTSVDWVVPTSGDYWIAVEGNTPGTRNLPNFDLEQETSATTGTAPALAFAYDHGTQFSTSAGIPFGVEITAAPEPAGWWFLAGGALLLLSLRARRSEA
jgi:hypothetical protein